MQASAPQPFLATTSFEERAWLSLVNAGTDVQIFVAMTRHSISSIPPRIQNTTWSPSDRVRASVPEGHGHTCSRHLPVIKEEVQFRFSETAPRHLQFRGAQRVNVLHGGCTVHHSRSNIRIHRTMGQGEDTI